MRRIVLLALLSVVGACTKTERANDNAAAAAYIGSQPAAQSLEGTEFPVNETFAAARSKGFPLRFIRDERSTNKPFVNPHMVEVTDHKLPLVALTSFPRFLFHRYPDGKDGQSALTALVSSGYLVVDKSG